jgi:hypothetical protein
MNREIVYALLGLLDESVTVELPSEAFDLSVDLFECLINGDSSDGDR